MTTYSSIANSEIAVGAPITNTLMTKLRDNPLAIQEGDATAPDIQGGAIADNTIAGAKFQDDSVTMAKMSLASSGMAGFAQGQIHETITSNGAVFVTVSTIRIYIDSNWSTLSYYVKNDAGSTSDHSDWRLTATATGTTVTINGGTAVNAWVGAGTLDISSESGWTTINVQADRTAGSDNSITALSWAVTA